MPLAHAQRHSQRFIKQVAIRHGDEELEYSIAPQQRLGSEPPTRHLEDRLTAADKNHTPVGNDHARREIDIVADEEHLAFPDDAVCLQRPPDGATRPTDRWHITRRFVLLFIAVRHACFPRCSRSQSW